jgi:hypothetical protein
MVQQLREAKKSGQPPETVVEKAGVKPEKLAAFSLIDEEMEKSEGDPQKKQSPNFSRLKTRWHC